MTPQQHSKLSQIETWSYAPVTTRDANGNLKLTVKGMRATYDKKYTSQVSSQQQAQDKVFQWLYGRLGEQKKRHKREVHLPTHESVANYAYECPDVDQDSLYSH